MKAIDLLKEGETAIAVFTRGDQFRVDGKGDGTTGNRKVKPGQMFDRAIIYHRVAEKSHRGAEVYLADFSGMEESDEPGRYIIQLSSIQHVGCTPLSWHQFAETGTNPVKYFR